ncbi:MAG: hypothetical protein HY342_01350 [Candidatus Lambdaproteobacteria bacterium]|nr:hypothetical protein [Candidatus Lambdaproteobacteria bacterium]
MVRLLLVGIAAGTLYACGASEPEPPPPPPPPTTEELAVQAAARRAEEEARHQAEIEGRKPPQQFFQGVQQEYQGPQVKPPPPPPPERPYDEAFPPKSLLPPPVRVGVLARPERATAAQNVALTLSEAERQGLEERIGAELNVVVVSRTLGVRVGTSEIHYRSGHLRAAMEIASSIPERQHIEPMTLAEEAREGFDVLIFVGTDIR